MTTTSARAIAPTIQAIALNHLAMQPVTTSTNDIARQQAIENALSAALWHIRHGTDQISIQAATGRAIRAASMLKQACAESRAV